MHINNLYLKKIQCLILSIVFFFITTSILNAQQDLLQQKVTADFKNTTLRKAFKQIEKQLSCYFTYESTTINNQKRISINLKNIPLQRALVQMLNDSLLIFKVVDNHVIIRKKRSNKKVTEIARDSIPEFKELRGKLVDADDGEVLPFATVSILGRSFGAIANAQGEFIFKVPKKYYDSQICIAHLGYNNLCLPVGEFSDSGRVYKLSRNFVSLQEVIIRKRDARAIIRAALEKRKMNYRTEPTYLTGFYRESVMRRSSYMFFSEAVVQLYKTSYLNDFGNDMIKVLKARKMKGLSIEDSVAVRLKSGLHACLELDIAKNPMNFLNEDNFSDYEYNMSDIVSYNGRNVYVIDFKQKELIKEALFQGKIYIDIEKLAFVGAEFSLNPDLIRKAQNQYITKKNRGIKLRMLSVEYTVNYHLVNDTYFFNYIRGHLKMKVRRRKKVFPVMFDTSFELAVSEVDTVDVKRFKRKEAENPYTVFFNEVHEYDESFWEHYNFIKPDIPLQEAIKKYSESKYSPD
jgi:hypothetical protein